MFGKKNLCAICGTKVSKSLQNQIGDGMICLNCGRICKKSLMETVQTISSAWEENHRRYSVFNQSMVITDFMGGYIYIDNAHQYAYISSHKKPKQEPIIFSFSEIEGYKIEKIGEKTISKTKNKGGIGRAVVGGALFGPAGAVVGAATSKTQTETKTVGGVPFLSIDLNLNGIKTDVFIENPPLQASQILDSMMNS